jgi:hypothetical protein
LSTVEGVGHRKLSCIIRVGHVKICRNFFKGMCIKIHTIIVSGLALAVNVKLKVSNNEKDTV